MDHRVVRRRSWPLARTQNIERQFQLYELGISSYEDENTVLHARLAAHGGQTYTAPLLVLFFGAGALITLQALWFVASQDHSIDVEGAGEVDMFNHDVEPLSAQLEIIKPWMGSQDNAATATSIFMAHSIGVKSAGEQEVFYHDTDTPRGSRGNAAAATSNFVFTGVKPAVEQDMLYHDADPLITQGEIEPSLGCSQENEAAAASYPIDVEPAGKHSNILSSSTSNSQAFIFCKECIWELFLHKLSEVFSMWPLTVLVLSMLLLVKVCQRIRPKKALPDTSMYRWTPLGIDYLRLQAQYKAWVSAGKPAAGDILRVDVQQDLQKQAALGSMLAAGHILISVDREAEGDTNKMHLLDRSAAKENMRASTHDVNANARKVDDGGKCNECKANELKANKRKADDCGHQPRKLQRSHGVASG